MNNILLQNHLIGKPTPMGMIQCIICMNEDGKDTCFGSKEEFSEHINMQHQTIDFKKLRYMDATEDQ